MITSSQKGMRGGQRQVGSMPNKRQSISVTYDHNMATYQITQKLGGWLGSHVVDLHGKEIAC